MSERVCLCSPDCLRTHCGDQTSLELIEISLLLPLPSAGIKGHHSPPTVSTLINSKDSKSCYPETHIYTRDLSHFAVSFKNTQLYLGQSTALSFIHLECSFQPKSHHKCDFPHAYALQVYSKEDIIQGKLGKLLCTIRPSRKTDLRGKEKFLSGN